MFYPPALMKKPISILATLALSLATFFHPVASAAKVPTPGATCTKLKATQVYKGKKYTCIKSGKKLVWNKGVAVTVTPTPSSSTSVTPSATPMTTTSPATPTRSASPIASPTASPTQTTSSATPTPTPTKVGYTMDEVKTHNSDKSCWSVVDGKVYDLTRWINSHPGGPGVIRAMCGVDGTRAFLNQHEGRREPIQRLAMYLLGPLSK
jgi:cytochrome b involved in lipid metabolism